MTKEEFAQLKDGSTIWYVEVGEREASVRAVVKEYGGIKWPDGFGADISVTPKAEDCFSDPQDAARELSVRLKDWRADMSSIANQVNRAHYYFR